MQQTKQVFIWLTREEASCEATQKELAHFLEPYQKNKYFFAIYRSGVQDLTTMTSALLLYNIQRAAERPVQ